MDYLGQTAFSLRPSTEQFPPPRRKQPKNRIRSVFRQMAGWGYCKHNGPHTWGEKYPLANGSFQSPVDIQTESCVDEETSKNLSFFYDVKAKNIGNTGAGWKVNTEGLSVLRGGPLNEKYKLEQFHCHWGQINDIGSEHTVDGKSFPAEIHFVHYNSEKYGSFDEAVDKEDGLAVLGVFFKVGSEHSELGKLISLMSEIPYSGDSVPCGFEIDPLNFIPENRSFWTYPGSLTTPPCLETVTWIVFMDPVEISEEQLGTFRDLCSYKKDEDVPDDEFEGRILANYRPPLQLGERKIRSCKSQ